LKGKDKFLVALDAGSTKTCALAAEVNAEGGLVFRALGSAESRGWRKGLIVNLDAAVACIRKAVEEAEQALGAPIERAVVGLGAAQVKGLNSRGGLNISSRPREVTAEEVRRALEVARTVHLPPDCAIVHVIPQDFVLDSQDSIGDPVGMVGARLEVNAHIVSAAAPALANLVASANRAGLVVDETVFEPLAAAEVVLNADERELGVVLADIGGGSTDVVVFRHGALQHSFTLPIGGEHFTNDIAVGLRTPIPDAEKIKRSFGVATQLLAGENTSIEVPSVGDRPSRLVPQRLLAEILEPRAQELLGLLRDELRRMSLDRQIGAGIVLTGGGARLSGLCDVAEDVFDAPARIGLPPKFEGAPDSLQHPGYAALVGLLNFAHRSMLRREAIRPGFFARLKSMVAGKS
jgi:cell division protein FtsA